MRFVKLNCRDEEKNVIDPLKRQIQPLWWDPFAKGGLGSWTPKYCHLISSRANLVWFSCTRLGFYGYRIQFHPSSHSGVSKHKVCQECSFLTILMYLIIKTGLTFLSGLQYIN